MNNDETRSSQKADACAILRDKVEAIAALSWEELDAYGSRVEEVVASSGRRFRIKSWAFWDMEAWRSGMYVIAKARPTKGLRRFWSYKDVRVRGGPDDPVPAPPSQPAD